MTKKKNGNWAVTSMTLATFAVSASACTSPMTKTAENTVAGVGRNPASVNSLCHPTPDDAAEAARVLASPGRYEDKRRARLRAMVQAYMLGAELLDHYDEMLDSGKPLAKIRKSVTYLKLLALHQIRQSIRHSLEDIYMVKIEQEVQTNPGFRRDEVVRKYTSDAGEEIQDLIRGGPDTLYARLALLDVKESFEDLQDYYVSCDHSVFQRNFDKRLATHNADVEELKKGAKVKRNAHKYFEPLRGEKGLHVADLVDRLAREMRDHVEFENLGRDPQSGPIYKAGVGTYGNMTGNGFPKGTWALTYDDGPAGTTTKVIDNLKKHDMKATFFMLTQQLKMAAYAAMGKREIAEGHAVASHSYTHANVPKLSAAGRQHEIVDAVNDFTTILGVRPKYFRLPYGSGTNVTSVRQIIADQGMIHVFWNVDTLDWQDKNPDSIVQRALKQMNQLGKGIILFHDIHPQSVVASEKLMGYLKDPANHIRTVTIPEIVDEMNAAAAARP